MKKFYPLYLPSTKEYYKDLSKYADIGFNVYGIPEIVNFGGPFKLKIGEFVSISQGVKLIFNADHAKFVSRFPFDFIFSNKLNSNVKSKSIEIGNDVIIGYNVTILEGSHISDGAIIGSNSVVRGLIKPYSIVLGNPAEEVGKRFPSEVVNELLRLEWWKWEDKDIESALPYICQDNVYKFLEWVRSNKLREKYGK